MRGGRSVISLGLLLSRAYFINGCDMQVTRDGGGDVVARRQRGLLQMGEGDVADGEGILAMGEGDVANGEGDIADGEGGMQMGEVLRMGERNFPNREGKVADRGNVVTDG